MGSDRFSIKTFLIAVLIAMVGFCLVWLVYIRAHWLLVADAAMLMILVTYYLFRYVNKANRQLNDFLSALENNDMVITVDTGKTSSWHRQVVERMNSLGKKLSLKMVEQERQVQFYKALAEHAGVGIIACDPSGAILFANHQANKLLYVKPTRQLNQLSGLYPNLDNILLTQPAGSHLLLHLKIAGSSIPVSFYITACKFLDQRIRIISFQNIGDELSKQEIESWQKLIRVLTHEIMNSTGPITSSIDTIREFLLDETGEAISADRINAEIIHDVLNGIAIVKERSIGLSRFVRDFRSLTFQPKLTIEDVSVLKLFENVRFLLDEQLTSHNIEVDMEVFPVSLQVKADPHLVEQVILNLTLNAIQAFGSIKNKKIRLKAFSNPNNEVVIQVTDNGEGVPDTIKDRIFVPFFTTREQGSGIGLSISQRILQQHNATIAFHSKPGEETCFEIVFSRLEG